MERAGDRPRTSVDPRADDPVVVIRVDEPDPGNRGDTEAYVRLRRWSEGDGSSQGDDADAAARDPDDGTPPKRLTIEL